MNATKRTWQFAIFDDALPAERFAKATDMLERVEYRYVHAQGVKNGVWRVADDGAPLVAPEVAWPTVAIDQYLPPGVAAADLAKLTLVYPTGKPIDDVMNLAREAALACPELVGREGSDWIGIICNPQLYPVGSGLSWHIDTDVYAGAFVYYAHREWNCQWGGELLIADRPRDKPFTDVMKRVMLDNDNENRQLMADGSGTYVMPKPNRLVILGDRQYHAIAKVNPAAGNHVRASFAGFFIRPEALLDLIKRRAGR